MKIVIQRVKKARVLVNNKNISSINYGMLLLVGFQKNDKPDFNSIINKILKMRIFNDDNGKMNKSISEIKGEILVISQFTLISNIQKGNRPSFKNACDYEKAKILYNQFIKLLNNYEINVEKGRFGAHMNLDFINDGPVTIIMDDRNE